MNRKGISTLEVLLYSVLSAVTLYFLFINLGIFQKGIRTSGSAKMRNEAMVMVTSYMNICVTLETYFDTKFGAGYFAAMPFPLTDVSFGVAPVEIPPLDKTKVKIETMTDKIQLTLRPNGDSLKMWARSGEPNRNLAGKDFTDWIDWIPKYGVEFYSASTNPCYTTPTSTSTGGGGGGTSTGGSTSTSGGGTSTSGMPSGGTSTSTSTSGVLPDTDPYDGKPNCNTDSVPNTCGAISPSASCSAIPICLTACQNAIANANNPASLPVCDGCNGGTDCSTECQVVNTQACQYSKLQLAASICGSSNLSCYTNIMHQAQNASSACGNCCRDGHHGACVRLNVNTNQNQFEPN